MSYLKLGKTKRVIFSTTGSNGAKKTADSTPVVSVWEQGVVLAYSPTVNLLGTGKYEAVIVGTTGNGFEVDKEYAVDVAATVDTIDGVDGLCDFEIVANGPGDLATAALLATAQTDLTTLTGRLTALRAGYMDALNIVGLVASRADVSNIAVTGAALNLTTGTKTITTGTGAGGVANTTQEDLVYDDVADSAGAIDFYYEFDLTGVTDGVGVGVDWTGYVVGLVNTIKVYARNWVGATWEQVGTIVGISGTANMTETFELTSAHTAAGLVRFRFAATGLTAATVKTDRILLGYTVMPASATAMASLQAAVAVIDDFVDDLEGRLTAARAGYLDNLSAGAVSQASALSTAQTAITAIKAKTDNLPADPAGLAGIASAHGAGSYEGGGLDATETASAVWDAPRASYADADSFGEGVNVVAIASAAANTIRDAFLNYAFRSGRTVRGFYRRADAFVTNRVTGLIGAAVTFFQPDNVTTEFSTTQDIDTGARGNSPVVTNSETP